ncbi:hypothetical protein PENFLA_c053G09877 [Penicillium flavigenum]|uniref:Uncharacterized protein n=1 Tax=Penicillium flavigenum TaxID=254877 RepID=A0A1V6SH90_9EURO|nr:hypothetical protein PENFLA_c053G09877 [Penicillium flavigenum]
MNATTSVQQLRQMQSVQQLEKRWNHRFTYRIVLKLARESTTTVVPAVGYGSKQSVTACRACRPVSAIDVWNFGQEKASDPKTQALAINSAHSITENQIHMHICDLNKKMKQDLTDLYTAHSKTPTFYSALREIKDMPLLGERMFCRAAQQTNQPISGATISADINTVLGRTDTCDYFVGAAVIIDNNGFTWSCVTADNESTEVKRFCA